MINLYAFSMKRYLDAEQAPIIKGHASRELQYIIGGLKHESEIIKQDRCKHDRTGC